MSPPAHARALTNGPNRLFLFPRFYSKRVPEMPTCPHCNEPLEKDASRCSRCGALLTVAGGATATPSGTRPLRDEAADEREEPLLRELSEEIVDSFIGEERLPSGRKISVEFWLGCARVAWRLIMPKANQIGFAVGFWVLRLAGVVVLVSWFYFGLMYAVWDGLKLLSALVTVFAGPLVLRGIEFVLENFLLRGFTRESWTDFWNFRRMMTPRSIQTAFFVGFWLLVGSGFLVVATGFMDLIEARELRDRYGKSLLSADVITRGLEESGESAPDEILQTLSPAARAARRFLPGAEREERTSETLKGQGTGLLGTLDIVRERTGRIGRGRSEDRPSERNCFTKIIAGLLYMVLGPLAFRFTCEWIILLFRVNETLTDISKQLDVLNRREAQRPFGREGTEEER